jgi:excinuclease UvrABC helicase subunit UvrB
MAKIKYQALPKDAIVDIQISGTFYMRMVDLLSALGESVGIDEFKRVLTKLKENNPAESLFEFNVHTLMALIYEVEKQAIAQNKCKEEEMEVPDEPTDNSPQPNPQA